MPLTKKLKQAKLIYGTRIQNNGLSLEMKINDQNGSQENFLE